MQHPEDYDEEEETEEEETGEKMDISSEDFFNDSFLADSTSASQESEEASGGSEEGETSEMSLGGEGTFKVTKKQKKESPGFSITWNTKNGKVKNVKTKMKNVKRSSTEKSGRLADFLQKNM